MLQLATILLNVAAVAGTMVLSPSMLTAGSTEAVYVSEGANSTFGSIVLVDSSGEIVSTAYPSSLSLYQLPVPASTSTGSGYKVQALSTTDMLLHEVSVEVMAAASLLMVENDKAFYKPGQTAKFRAFLVTLAEKVPIADEPVQLRIVGPNGYTLMQSQDVLTDSFGVVRFEFPVATLPLLGTYTATAQAVNDGNPAATHEISFIVDEYVLPRFEVTASIHNRFLVADSQASADEMLTVTGLATAMYTFGEAVRASSINITVMMENQWMYWGWGGAVDVESNTMEPRDSFSVLATTLLASPSSAVEDLEFEVMVPTNRLAGGSPLTIEVTVQDAATGEVQSGLTTLPVAFDSRGIEVDLSPAHGGAGQFKPGLPVEVQVALFNADGSSTDLTSSSVEQVFLAVSHSVVDYAQRVADLFIPINASEFNSGVTTVSFTLDAESSECCKPNAVSADYKEYMNNTGCCVKSLSIWLQDSTEARFFSSSERTSTLCMERAYSPTQHYLDLQFATVAPSPGSTANVLMRTTVSDVDDATRMEYLLLQGSSVVGSGSISLTGVTVTGAAEARYTQGSFEVFMPQTMAGECKVVAMLYLPDNQVVTGSASVNMTVAFPVTLSVAFGQQETTPGENVVLEATLDEAESTDTRVFLTAVDRSVELMGKRTRVDEGSVLGGISRAAGQEAQSAPRAWRECFCFGRYAPILTELRETDLQLLPTDLPASCEGVPERLNVDLPYGDIIRGPLGEICPRPLFSPGMCGGYGGDDDMMFDGVPEMALDAAGGGGMQRSQDESGGRSVHVRRSFPETWLWTEITVPSATETHEAAFLVPDTITSWTLEAFSSTPGVGMAAAKATQSLRVFKPVFVEIRLPHSAIRGEDMQMTIVVFNYMDSQQQVSLTLTLPDEIEQTGMGNGLTQAHAIDSQMSTTVRVRVKPNEIGTFAIRVQASTQAAGIVDVIQRSLLVKPEGFVVRKVSNGVIQLQDGVSSQEKVLSLHVPEDAVSGSAFASITSVGDIMGPTLQGLERLLTIPSGCGEQNMMTLAPNVYVGKYLHSVGRLSADIQQRIVRNIVIGYGRQLTYQRSDGSFSAFGEQDNAGSTWLTAFTIRVFAEVHASGLASVDPQVMIDASEWLLTLLDEDESFFQSSGMVIHQEMMGGIGNSNGHGRPIGFLGPPETPDSQPQMSEIDRKAALTSFVVIALTRVRGVLEPNLLPAGFDDALTRARGYLTSKAAELSEHAVYAKVLSAYARVAADPSDSAVDEIVALATTESGGLVWRAACADPPCYGATALDVELTGYAVMILTTQGSLGQAFLGVRWLLQQRNSGGGFISTQDTVVALKALSEYAGEVRGNADVTVLLEAGSPLSPSSATMVVDETNFDVLQRLPLNASGEKTIAPGTNMSVVVTAQGEGVTLVSLDLQYNMLHPEVEPCYGMEVAWEGGDDSLIGVTPCVRMLDSCSRPDGSGMMLLNVGLFTGYAASRASLDSLVHDRQIKKYEVDDQQVTLYVDEVLSGELYCAPFDAIADFDVTLLQPAPSEVFEYYAPHNRGDALTHWDTKHITSFTTTESAPASRSPSLASKPLLWPIATAICMIATLAVFQ